MKRSKARPFGAAASAGGTAGDDLLPAINKAAGRKKAAKADKSTPGTSDTDTKADSKANGKKSAKATKTLDVVQTRELLIRDSFTLPREDFELIALLKDRALGFRRPTKKSELLRAGLQLLARLDSGALQGVLEALRPLKAGRPKKKR